MGLKLKNHKEAESKLAKFVEDIIVPPRMIEIIGDGEICFSNWYQFTFW
ncbi:Vacuolar protein sorting-associated protein 52 [Orobanche minor]